MTYRRPYEGLGELVRQKREQRTTQALRPEATPGGSSVRLDPSGAPASSPVAASEPTTLSASNGSEVPPRGLAESSSDLAALWTPPAVAPKAKRKASPERAILKAITKALTSDGHLVLRRSVGFTAHGDRKITYGTPGEPDLEVLLGHGLVCFLEVKAPDGRLSPKQAAYHARLRDRGYQVATVRSVAEARAAVSLARRAA